MHTGFRPLALVTGASSGIGYNLALCCAKKGFDLLVAADQSLETAAMDCWALGAEVETVQTELARPEGVNQLLVALRGRTVDALLANAGHGLGHSFLAQDFGAIQHVIDTNITGTLYLLHKVAPAMCARGQGRILITGSIAGFQPGAFQAVYNGTQAFIDSFAAALRNELKDSGVTVTCLMPGVTDTGFFARADMLDTRLGTDEHKDDPAEVAKIGFEAMMNGEAGVVTGMKNKLQAAMSKVMPSQMAAEQHRKVAAPGSAEKS
ncbi:MAG: SDR family NAD(P)-dependent oxidoreductase [Pseudomonadota bacterium]